VRPPFAQSSEPTAASFLFAGELLVAAEPPPRASHCLPQPPRKLSRTPLTLTSHSPWPDLHWSYLAAVLLSLVSSCLPSSPYLRPSSVQFNYSTSFLLSCCSSQAQAWSPSSPGIPSLMSTLPLPSRLPWGRPFRPSSPLPKTYRRCALTSWCSLTTLPPPPAVPSPEFGRHHPYPSSPTSQGYMCKDFKSVKGVLVNFQSPPNSKVVSFKNA
jgi:hypothetical protein